MYLLFILTCGKLCQPTARTHTHTHTQLSTNNLAEIPPRIGRCENLHTLYINNNRLAVLPDEICRIKTLTALSVCNNNIQKLPDMIATMTQVRKHLSLLY